MTKPDLDAVMAGVNTLLREFGKEHPDDAHELLLIMTAPDGVTAAERIRAYYADMDRSERTPREFLYLHIGSLCGTLEQLVARLSPPGSVH